MATATAVHPGKLSDQVSFRPRYGNYIGGKWVEPASGQYFENVTPVTGKTFCEIPRSNAQDIERALDAAHAARAAWGHTSPTHRANLMIQIAQRMEDNLEMLALAETWDNGKPIRESMAADLPLAIDHWRYFASCIRAQEGTISEIDQDTVAYHYHEPLGVVGQIIPWNFPLLMAVWKLAPALAAGNCVVLKPAEQTPLGMLVLAELIAEILPPGVLNVVNGFGLEAGKPLAQSKRIAKIAFTGETTTGRLIMQYASENIIPVTLELGGKSPNIFFADVMDADDDYFDKTLEGFAMFSLNEGEVCTCPSRVLVQESIYDKFMERAVDRVKKIKLGHPLDMTTMIGAQASTDQLEKILSYFDIGRQEGAQVLTGGKRAHHSLAVIMSSRPSSLATTRCACSRRRSSGQWCRLRSSRTRRMRSQSRTIRSTDSARASGRATATRPIAWVARSRPAVSGPTATTPIRRTPPSADTRLPASAARPTR